MNQKHSDEWDKCSCKKNKRVEFEQCYDCFKSKMSNGQPEDVSDSPNFFVTRDLYLAAALLTLKFKKVGVDYQIEGERRMPVGYFKFERTVSINEAVYKFWNGDLAVEPRDYVTAIRSLKSEVTNTYKGPHSQFRSQG